MTAARTPDRPTTDRLTIDPAEEELHAAAVRRLRRKREFLEHLVSYLIVNGLLVAVWLVLGLTAGSWFPWPLFPIAGWGIGLAFHAWATFGTPSRPISEDSISREMERLSKL